MNKYAIRLVILTFLCSLSLSDSSMGTTLHDVHSWPDSKCDLCHLSATPDSSSLILIEADQSRLCESCHTGSLSIPTHSGTGMLPAILSNHPVKFSPLDFDAERINQNIIQKGDGFYVSGPGGDVRLFGTTLESAVTECSSCHDPHGKSGLPLLHYTSNLKDDLCLICHINMINTM